jgi:hypothetical protein
MKMIKEKIIETVGTSPKALEVVAWYRHVEKKLGGKKKFTFREHPYARGYQIIMED